MQNHHQDAPFDDNKYYFPPNTLTSKQSQPWLEVAPVRDEQGTPGLQPISHDGHKYADVATLGGMRDGTAPYRTQGTAHADEITSQGLQAVPTIATERYLAQSQSQPQPQFPWPNPNASHHYGQSFQTLPSSQVSGFSSENLAHVPQLASSSAERQYLNPSTAAGAGSSWVKDERHILGNDKEVKVKRWVLWAIGGAVVLLLGIGATLGGIMGSRAHWSVSYDGTESNITSNGTSTSPPKSTPTQSIKVGSRLAVTGYRTDADYGVRLFFQDQDNQIRFTDKEHVSANWTKTTVLDTLLYQPMENGSIAAGSYLFADPVPNLEFFYEDKDGIIRGQNFNFEFEKGKFPPKGEPGSINTYPLQTAGKTRISCYFPYIASQDASNAIRWTTLRGQNASDLSAPWWVNDTNWNIKASEGGGMVVLPIAQTYENAGGIIYRSNEGMLSLKIRDGLESSNDGVAWRKGALSKKIPADTPIGAFSVGRPYDNNNQVNTYILYQDDDGIIQVVWQDDDTGWKGPQTYDALDGAEKGADIACLTPGAYEPANIGISREQDMNRCFFRIGGGKVKEVWFNGTNWVSVGIVPIT
ncbi:hypothetical protein F5Y00DRAFT_237047 [Daldinia vernicosa]|uniref:uncharacterized protein n=1 Tax=Daldinia vernicosa TaxID=114800 RepID=UPI0020079531|nr:uncharacterized protein F5Y00DRAFT_237047 [Daldinia vernicosa]KAI0848914.1 hypothetical protein F5Y00DRAFT_237047 [Daldinia vernicosa]